jgi:hypothetical protein
MASLVTVADTIDRHLRVTDATLPLLAQLCVADVRFKRFHDLRPVLSLQPTVDGDGALMTLQCEHPATAHRSLTVSCRIGLRHQQYFARWERDRVVRRCGTLIRLLLSRLLREVERAAD